MACDLEEGVFLLAALEYPDLRRQQIGGAIDALAEGVRPELEGLQPPALVERLSRHLFVREGFRGDVDDYENPDNSWFNRVLERRRGIPITLSTVLLLTARRLGLPIVGVGMPRHFLAKYWDDEHEIFIDAFGGGATFGRSEANRRLVETGLGFQPALLDPVGAREILDRMVRNLFLIYHKRGDAAHLERLRRFSVRARP